MSTNENRTVQQHKDYLFPATTMYYQEPIELVRGEGPWVWDHDGKKYLDAFGGVLTVSVGHANPKVVDAIVEQVRRSTTPRRSMPTRSSRTWRRSWRRIAPGNLKKTFFTSSGTEANETAVARGARCHRSHPAGRRCGTATPVAAPDAGHVRAEQLEEAAKPDARHPSRPRAVLLPLSVQSAPIRECGLKCAEDIEELILTETGGEIAAFFAETVIGAGGFIVPPPGLLRESRRHREEIRRLVHRDEVQTAWGRTGEHMFGIDHWKVRRTSHLRQGHGQRRADRLTIATPEVADKYPGVTFATFGGNPVFARGAARRLT